MENKKSPNEIEVKEHEILFDGTVHHKVEGIVKKDDLHYYGIFEKIPLKGQVIKDISNNYYRITDEPEMTFQKRISMFVMGIERINL